MDNGSRAVSKEKACSSTPTRISILVNGETTRKKDREPMCSMQLA